MSGLTYDKDFLEEEEDNNVSQNNTMTTGVPPSLPVGTSSQVDDVDETDEDELKTENFSVDNPNLLNVITLDDTNNTNNLTNDDNIPPQTDIEVEKSSVIGKVADFTVGAMRDIGTALSPRNIASEVFAQIPKGVASMTAEGLELFDDVFKVLRFSPYGGRGMSFSGGGALKDKELLPETDSPVMKLADTIDRAKKVFPEAQTGTGQFVNVMSQYFGGYATLGKVIKGGYKSYYTKEAMTGFIFFDPEENNLTTALKEMDIVIPGITDILLKEEDDSKFEKRVKTAIEAAALLAPFDVPKVITAVKNIRKHKSNINDAKAELVEFGEVSQSTREALVESAEALKESDDLSGIKLTPSSAKKAEAEGWSRNYAKVVSKTEEMRKQKREINSTIAATEKNIRNDLFESFEKKLTVNKGLQVTDEEFTRVTKVVDGLRQLDSELLREAKNKELSPEVFDVSVTDSGVEIDEFRFTDSSKRRYLEAKRENEVEDLFNRTLKTENIDALVVVAKELKDYEGGKYWKTTKKEKIEVREIQADGTPKVSTKEVDVVMRPMESIFESIVALGDDGVDMTFGTNHPLWDALDKAGMSFEDFTKDALGAVSEAGQILGKFSKLSNRLKPKSVEQDEILERELKRQGGTRKFIRRVLDIGRGMMVSAIATAARNLESGLARSPVEALNNIIETATYDLAQGNFASNKALKRTTWQDSFRSQRYIYSDQKTAKEFTDLLLKNDKMMKFYKQMFNTINEIQLNTGRGEGGFGDKTLSALEDLTKLLNTPNRWQDFMLRRATFLSEAERLFRLEWDMDLLETLRAGRLDDILSDARDLNPTIGSDSKKTITSLDILARANNRALDLTYASQPELDFSRTITDFIVKNNLTGFVAFPRFIFKSMELMAENSAGIAIPALRRIYGTGYLVFGKGKLPTGKNVRELDEQTGLKAGFRKYSKREHRMIARNTTGAAAIYGAYLMFKDQPDVGEDYKFVELTNGTRLDTSPMFPIRQYLFLGKMANSFAKAKEDNLDNPSAFKEAILETFDGKEWLETFGGSDFRFGFGGNIIDEAARLFSAEDLRSEQYVKEELGEALGSFWSRYFQWFGQATDLQRGLEQRGLVYKETKKDPEIVNKGGLFPDLLDGSFMKEFTRKFYRFDPVDFLFDEEKAPERVSILDEGGVKERRGPLFKLTIGTTMFNPRSELGKKMVSYGFDDFDVMSKSRIASIKNYENNLIKEFLPKIVEIAEDREALHKDNYEKNADTLSKIGGGSFGGRQFGISEGKYVKKMLAEDIGKMLKFVQGNERELTAVLKKDKRKQIIALIDYSKLPATLKAIGNLKFIEKFKREPLNITEEVALDEIPNYESMSDIQKETAVKNLLAKDMMQVTGLGKSSAINF